MCTRSRVLVSGATCVIRHWRQGRDRAGGCAQGRLPLYYGDSGRVHTVLPRESKSPRVSAARTHGTHTQQGRPRPASRALPPPPPQSSYFPGPWAPFTPTAPLLAPANRYHSNRKISQWTRPARISFSLSFFSSSFLFRLLRFYHSSSFFFFRKRRSLDSIAILRPCDSGLVLRQDLKEENNLLFFFFFLEEIYWIRFLLNRLNFRFNRIELDEYYYK